MAGSVNPPAKIHQTAASFLVTDLTIEGEEQPMLLI